jgi:hypothetical protein
MQFTAWCLGNVTHKSTIITVLDLLRSIKFEWENLYSHFIILLALLLQPSQSWCRYIENCVRLWFSRQFHFYYDKLYHHFRLSFLLSELWAIVGCKLQYRMQSITKRDIFYCSFSRLYVLLMECRRIFRQTVFSKVCELFKRMSAENVELKILWCRHIVHASSLQ